MQHALPATGRHRIPLQELTREAFAPYGQVIEPRHVQGQFIMPPHNPGTSADEAQLTLDGGIPRLWIMQLRDYAPEFSEIARHNRVTQCLGALGDTEWMMAVAPPDAASAGPELAAITGFRIRGPRIIKLHIGTWHAGPHFLAPEASFLNLENMNTRREDFEAASLPVTCTYDFG